MKWRGAKPKCQARKKDERDEEAHAASASRKKDPFASQARKISSRTVTLMRERGGKKGRDH